MVNFNLSEEVLETVHAIAMKMIFGDSIISNESDKLRIDMGSKLVEMSLPMAFRAVWSQHLGKSASVLRLFLFDPLSDWCLTPSERRARKNAGVIREYLLKKVKEHEVWRKNNPIEGADEPIYACDIFMADKKMFQDEDYIIDAIISAIFGFSQTTASTTAQTLYQLVRNQDCKAKLLKDLTKKYAKKDIEAPADNNELDQEEALEELRASKVAEKIDVEEDNL